MHTRRHTQKEKPTERWGEGARESQSDLDMQRCTDGNRKELQDRDKERDREKKICRDMHRQRQNSLKHRLRDGLKERER